MTEQERVFQAMLDADPGDWQTRLVLADYLDEIGDPRAAGYRALGLLRRMPQGPKEIWRFMWSSSARNRVTADRWVIPADWYATISKILPNQKPPREQQEYNESRRSAEDKLARGFLRLPAARRERLLAYKFAFVRTPLVPG